MDFLLLSCKIVFIVFKGGAFIVLLQVNALRCEYNAMEASEAECKQLYTEIEKCKMQQNCVDNSTGET